MLTACSAVSPSAYGGHLYPGNNSKLCNALSPSLLPSASASFLLSGLRVRYSRLRCARGGKEFQRGFKWIRRGVCEFFARQLGERIRRGSFQVTSPLFDRSDLLFTSDPRSLGVYPIWRSRTATTVLWAKISRKRGTTFLFFFFFIDFCQTLSWDHR